MENFVFLLPACLLIFVYKYIGLIYTFYLSLTKYDGIGKPTWIGLLNFKKLVRSEIFWLSLRNVSEYTLLLLPSVIILGLFLALLLNTKFKGRNLIRTIHFIPLVISLAAMAYIFKMLMGRAFGPIPQLMKILHLPVIDFLNHPKWAMEGLVIMMIWKLIGFNILIFLAGLQTINPELYEVASIDGATKYQEFIYITLPLLRPTILFLTIVGFLGAMQIFDPVLILPPPAAAPGAPGTSLYVPILAIYSNAFLYGKWGFASALSVALFTIMFIIVLVQSKIAHLESPAGYS